MLGLSGAIGYLMFPLCPLNSELRLFLKNVIKTYIMHFLYKCVIKALDIFFLSISLSTVLLHSFSCVKWYYYMYGPANITAYLRVSVKVLDDTINTWEVTKPEGKMWNLGQLSARVIGDFSVS